MLLYDVECDSSSFRSDSLTAEIRQFANGNAIVFAPKFDSLRADIPDHVYQYSIVSLLIFEIGRLPPKDCVGQPWAASSFALPLKLFSIQLSRFSFDL